MSTFAYTARKLDGSRIHGTLDARDRQAAIARIEQEGGTPIQVTEKSCISTHTITETPPAHAGMCLPLAQLFLFSEQLAHLLSAGMTLDEALGVLVNRLQTARLKALAGALHRGLVDGRSLSQAMLDFPRIFPPLYVNLVAAGESSGALPQILKRLVAHLANVKTLRERVRQALIYPAALGVAGVALVIVFMTVMVPQLTKFLATTGQSLPAATRMLIGANHALLSHGWLALLVAGVLAAIGRLALRKPEAREAWHRALWNFPALGRIPRYRFYAQFARTLATLGENGVTLLKSLELLEGTAGNLWVQGELTHARSAVMEGAPLSQALRERALFPPLFLDMMAVGEQTGRFAETMGLIADVHERELDQQVQFVSTVVPLAVIVLVAVVVGLIVFAILSAVFGLTSGLQGRIH